MFLQLSSWGKKPGAFRRKDERFAFEGFFMEMAEQREAISFAVKRLPKAQQQNVGLPRPRRPQTVSVMGFSKSTRNTY